MEIGRRRLAGLLGVIVLVTGAVAVISVTADTRSRPEIIVISVNSLRADHLSCYGYHRNTTPNICELARDGILYENVTAAYAWTTPSSTSFLSGVYPQVHGLYLKPKQGNRSVDIPDEITTLPELLDRRGYNTTAMAQLDRWTIPPASNILDGFDQVRNVFNPKRVVDRISHQNGSTPRFTYAQIKALHRPYRVPLRDPSAFNSTRFGYMDAGYDGFFTRFRDHRFQGPGYFPPVFPNVRWQGGGYVYHGPNHSVNLTEEDLEFIRNRYDTALRWVDDRLGVLFEELKEQGRYREAMIVVMAPHGEALGRYPAAQIGHTIAVPPVVGVPLIIKPPGGTDSRRVEGQVELIDIYPTLLSFIGMQPPELVQGQVRRAGDGARYAFTGRKRVQTEEWVYWPAGSWYGPALFRRGAEPPRKDHSGAHPAVARRLSRQLRQHRSANRLLHARLTEDGG